MNFKQLVFRNVTRNGRAYASYFLSSLFSVMAFFIFSLLFFHPTLNNGKQGSSETVAFLAQIGMQVAQVVIVIMSFVFLWYTFSIFLKARKRDFSIYLILGMSEKDLRRMIFLENTLLGLGSVITGILVGTFFSKFVLLVSQNLLAIEEGLAFYLPVKPVLLTFIVYMILFSFISIITTFTIKVANLTEMSKADERPIKVGKTTWYYAVGSLLLIALGYGAILKFVFDVRFSSGYALGLILVCVLLTIAGTYVFFQQNSVRFFSFLQGRKIFYKKVNMLTITNLIYRMKINGTMYFMIAIVATVAFVGIGVTMAIGGQEFAQTQASSFAYSYTRNAEDEEDMRYHQENIDLISQRIKHSGFEPLVLSFKSAYLMIEDEQLASNYVNLIPVSSYNKLARFTGDAEIMTDSDQQIVILATSNTNLKEIQNSSNLGKEVTSQAYQGMSDEPITVNYVLKPVQFNIGYGATAVVSDKFYTETLAIEVAKLKAEGIKYTPSEITIIHYREWAELGQIDRDIRGSLDVMWTNSQEEINNVYGEAESNNPSEFSDEEQEKLDKALSRNFEYTSMYQTWIQTKQSNGLILLVSVLLGSVFFTFAACIIYFRLFGELESDGKYHRSLHILGIPRKNRHQIVTKEMLIMYFIPIVVAMAHFAMAMYALNVLIELPVFTYYWQIIGAYVVFQLIFFLISRWRYLHHLDYRAEKN
ncbi:FtsX-like permease family protein [Vagococcus salmoninarum]|uniref:ABC3 transporter permease C-terminal domain-containing protein n=1 Tax=Vagococcus salmoninarum TaxID=2739 RepID=A0A429ZTF2_9ENTE|nr:ABC transporter permease [Vagococcus salmoninarum]MBE9389810.1 ABC transporter permease [Vagococcus salmoninarum]RST96900.1 hypothetical protein CBF35_04840 [Vagococcus salmoninarum]